MAVNCNFARRGDGDAARRILPRASFSARSLVSATNRSIYSAMGDRESVDDLVPGRRCGSCTVCCKTLKISAPELKKPSDVLCPNCTRAGCRVYESRPSVCAEYHCGWRVLRHLSDDWRPDRSGVLIDVVEQDQAIPAGFRQVALKFDVIDSPGVLSWEPLIRFIGSEIGRGHPVFLGTPAPVGYERRKVFLNHMMAEAVAARDLAHMIDGLRRAFQIGVADATKEKTTFD
jgi:hypothetical protein